MIVAAAAILVTSLYPLAQAFRSNGRTSLSHALVWAGGTWLAWGAALACALIWPDSFPVTATYGALAMTGCAGMAVLGARRPGVMAWNFVVAGLLIVLLLPLAEGWGELRLSPVRLIFLAMTLAVVPFNYLATRMSVAALVLVTGCGLELTGLSSHAGIGSAAAPDWLAGAGGPLVALSPWIAWGLMKTKASPASEFNALWLDFRDRFGVTWSLRMREQFNRAAANAGWQARLGWSGLHGPPEEMVQPDQLQTLRALLKRFGL
jgi:hypothetical protein